MKKIYKKLIALENDGKVDYDISHRGGHYGLSRGDVSDLLGLGGYADMLPGKVGAFCNYLGGGLRGSVSVSDYDKAMPKKYAKRIDAYLAACHLRYLELESGAGLNDETFPDGDTNWDAIGTNASRKAGIISAY